MYTKPNKQTSYKISSEMICLILLNIFSSLTGSFRLPAAAARWQFTFNFCTLMSAESLLKQSQNSEREKRDRLVLAPQGINFLNSYRHTVQLKDTSTVSSHELATKNFEMKRYAALTRNFISDLFKELQLLSQADSIPPYSP